MRVIGRAITINLLNLDFLVLASVGASKHVSDEAENLSVLDSIVAEEGETIGKGVNVSGAVANVYEFHVR